MYQRAGTMIIPMGPLIVLEGISGSGKSTIHKLLTKEFPQAFFNVEPTHSLFGAVIRSVYERRPFPLKDLELAMKYAEKGYGNDDEDFWLLVLSALEQVRLKMTIDELSMQLLFMADRVYDLKENIHPQVSAMHTVIQDRYFASTLAYGASGGLPMDKLINWQMKAFRSFRIPDSMWKPDLMIVLDLDAVTAMERLKSSGKVIDVFEEKIERLTKIREGYLQLAANKDIFPNVALVDANAGLEEVFSRVVSLIKATTENTATTVLT